ncbi:hypothetical protein Galf_2574 [Gallionella capsiferriformans ES-2]|uniref:Uncharacterized protein n=1 Tax=Gallionella capsiferriformans (strain ES-2) TaxID=395494 RepID=D9SCJ1_GALCS|nr:hypothetical protein Galf_2574 [Gallionella capsiferriformans ES-2]
MKNMLNTLMGNLIRTPSVLRLTLKTHTVRMLDFPIEAVHVNTMLQEKPQANLRVMHLISVRIKNNLSLVA